MKIAILVTSFILTFLSSVGIGLLNKYTLSSTTKELNKNSLIKLDEGWRIIPGKLVKPGRVMQHKSLEAKVGGWHEIDEKFGKFGKATYFTTLRDFKYDGDLSLLVNPLFSAWELFVVTKDGKVKPHLKVGKVGKTKDGEVPSFRSHYIKMLPEDAEKIVIHLSNFHYRSSKFQYPLIGDSERVNKLRLLQIVYKLAIMASSFIFGVYCLLVYTSYRKDSLFLWLGLLSISFALRSLTAEAYLTLVLGENFFIFTWKINCNIFLYAS